MKIYMSKVLTCESSGQHATTNGTTNGTDVGMARKKKGKKPQK